MSGAAKKREIGPQRRRDASGRVLHRCCVCPTLAPWGDGWSAYCSMQDQENGSPYPKFCSPVCRAKGGARGRLVPDAVLAEAREAEWREPERYVAPMQGGSYADALAEQMRRERLRRERGMSP